MAALELEFSVFCHSCGDELEVEDFDNASKYRGASIKVKPCDKCIEGAIENAKED